MQVDFDAGYAFCPRFFDIQPALVQFKGTLTNINAPAQSMIDIQPSLIDFKGAAVSLTDAQPCPGGPLVTDSLAHRTSGAGDVVLVPDEGTPVDLGPVDTSTGSVVASLPAVAGFVG